MAALALNLGARYRQAVNFMPRPLCPTEQVLRALLPLPGFEPRTVQSVDCRCNEYFTQVSVGYRKQCELFHMQWTANQEMLNYLYAHSCAVTEGIGTAVAHTMHREASFQMYTGASRSTSPCTLNKVLTSQKPVTGLGVVDLCSTNSREGALDGKPKTAGSMWWGGGLK